MVGILETKVEKIGPSQKGKITGRAAYLIYVHRAMTWFPQARKYYFPGHNYHFPG